MGASAWMAPSLSVDDETLNTLTTFFRMTGGPGTALALETQEREADIRHVLPAVHGDLVAGSGLAFEERGEHELKGVPDRWRLYGVVSEPT